MLKAALPGNYFVDIFPWMMHIPQWIPGARWKREGFEWFKKDTDMFQQLVEDTHMEQASKPHFRGSMLLLTMVAACSNVEHVESVS